MERWKNAPGKKEGKKKPSSERTHEPPSVEEKRFEDSWFTGSNPDAVQSTGCSPDHRPDGVRKVSGKSIGAMFFFIGAEPRVMNQETDRAETEKKPKTFLVHRIEPGCSPIDRMQSGPPTGWSPEGVRKIDRCNVFFHRGRTSSNEPGNRSSRNREKNPKHSWFTGSNPDAVQSTGCSPDHRPDGVRKVSGKSIGAMFFGMVFFFIGAEPRVMNQEIDRAETEKKTQNIPGSPDRTRMQSNRPDAVRTTDRMESGRCPENRSVQFFFHRGRTSSNEPGNRSSRNREKNPKHSWFTGSNPDAVQSTGCSPDHRPDGVRKVSRKSIGAMFFFIGAEPRVMNQETDQAETEKKTQNIPGSPDRTRMQSNRPDAVRTTDWMESGRCPEDRSVQCFFSSGPNLE